MPQDYPIPRFHFQVDWGGSKLSFTEVTGLVMEREKIEYRHSDSKDFNKIAMPGLVKNNNITLKRGKFEGDFEFNTWLELVANERVEDRRDVTIRLLNEKHEPGRGVDGGALLPGQGHRAGPEVRRQRGRHREPGDRPRGPEADEDLAGATVTVYYPPWGFYYKVEFEGSQRAQRRPLPDRSRASASSTTPRSTRRAARTASPTSCRCAPSTPTWC